MEILTGSEKQIKWANSLRDEEIADLEKWIKKATATEERKSKYQARINEKQFRIGMLKKETDSTVIIEMSRGAEFVKYEYKG